MASHLKQLFSIEEYFALERASERRFEYWDGEIVCMSGGSRQHGRLCANIHSRLSRALDGSNCTAFTGDQALDTPALPPYRYPDVSVACGELKYRHIQGSGIDLLVNPVLVVEVESPSTTGADHGAGHGTKFHSYQAIPSFREYLVVAQNSHYVTHYARQSDDTWAGRTYTDGVIELSSLGCSLMIDEIYEGVPEEPADAVR